MRNPKRLPLDARLLLAVAAALCVLYLTALAREARSEAVEFSVPEVCPTCPLVLGDLSLQLYQNGAPIADPGVTLTEQTNGREYTLDNLPDVAAGSGDRLHAAWEVDGVRYGYSWPLETRTPQALVFTSTVRPIPGQLRVAVGDTLPVPSVRVVGLSSDPTGSSVTFSMSQGSGPPKVNAQPAVVSDVDQAVGGSWEMTLKYNWSPTDTDTAENYRGWFVVTFPSATCGPGGASPCVSTYPADRSLRIQIISQP